MCCEQCRLHFSFVDLDTRYRCHTSRAHNRILADRRMGAARIMYALFFTTSSNNAECEPKKMLDLCLARVRGEGLGKIRATQYLVCITK